MSKLSLNAIATQALVDKNFRADILNGHRKERLNEFELSNKEIDAVLSIKAESVDQFICQLGDWMYSGSVMYA